MSQKHAVLRAAAYIEGQSEFQALAQIPTFTDFVCLYIAEGSKRCRNRVAICNSDPQVMALAHRWVMRFATNRITYYLQYHADQDVSALRRFWGELMAVAPTEVRVQRKSNSGQLNGRHWRSRYGVLTIAVGDTRFRMRLEAWMDLIRTRWLDSLPLGA